MASTRRLIKRLAGEICELGKFGAEIALVLGAEKFFPWPGSCGSGN